VPTPPQEILPGVWHWRAYHQGIGQDVGSYYLAEHGVLIDPMLPEGGVAWFSERGGVADILLSCRHHYRHSGDFVEAFGCGVGAPRSGLHEFTRGEPVQGFDPGDALPGGVVACEVGALSPDETALHIPAARALVVADGIVQWEPGGPLTFVPDFLMGDDPEAVKAGLAVAFERLLALDFEHLLLTHRDPVLGDGKDKLRTFLG
jgi:hypothetical protein